MSGFEICAVTRDCLATGERLGYVAGLGENAGTCRVSMTFDSAVAEAERLNELGDGYIYMVCSYA
jgi:hypothetical protein